MPKLSTENLLRLCIGSLIVFATLMLGIGDQSVALTLVTLVVVPVATYLTDITKRFQLGQTLANWVALGVVAASAISMLSLDRAEQVGAVANLQSYLQYVLLFQPKTARVYWQLALLSLGQVAIAATLVPGLLFGVMLLGYVMLGVATFAIVLIESESARFGAVRAGVQPVGNPGLWPNGAAPILSGGVAPAPRGLGIALCAQLAAIAAVTLCATTVLFFFIPRRMAETRVVASNEPLRTVGFSKTITLGELGEVVQNPDVVMRIQFFRGRSMRPFQLADEPLFRGSVVTRYKDGAWSQARHGSTIGLSTQAAAPFVRQHITVEPMDVAELFCIVPVFALRPDPRLRIDANNDQLLRQDDWRTRSIEFEVGTTGIRDNRMRDFLPCQWRLHSSIRSSLLQMPSRDDDSDPLAGLRQTATRVLAERGIDPANRVAAARALDEYLRLSGQFLYSLDWQPRDRTLDPLEDFVTVHRAGHCEYFAGALVMMLRSQNIPARMAIGFKGGEWNPLGQYYQVQQLHAHAWVEVYLDEEEIPPDAFAQEGSVPPGAWLVLDPTVSESQGGAGARQPGLMARFQQSLDYAQVLWSNYVVGLNSKRQEEGVYGPIQAGARAAFENMFGAETWQRRLRALNSSHVGTFWQWYRKHWFSWRGGLVAVGASAVLTACYFALRWLIGLARRVALAVGGAKSHAAPTLEMYRRLEAALARRGCTRHHGQTAHEFALAAAGHLAESKDLQRVSHLPRRIVESFYRVRFGGRTLDNREAEAVELALCELEVATAQPR